MDLIFTNPNREDVGVLHNYEFDLAFGSDENNFECTVGKNDHCCAFGSYLYIEGTEYGGIVDSIKSANSAKEVIYSGRTWHGILNSKVLQPDSGQAYLTVSGEVNAVIASLIARMGLSDLFEVSAEDSGLTVSSYKMNRYISGYEGILKMLKTVGGKLLFRVQKNCQVLLSVVPVVDYTQEELDSDLLDLDVKKTANTVNHLICLGTGELENRTVIHLYADENGNISQTQTFSGTDEYVAVFDYPNAEDETELLNSGIEKLKELMQQDDIAVDVNDVDDPYDIGDIVGASDNVTNIRITVPVTKKIVTIRNGVVTIDIQTEKGNITATTNNYSGSSGSPGEPGQDGQDGADGVSCTHEWNGTVLTVTSASGTSSADLKGAKGDTGPQGIQGEKGDTGATGPQGEQGEKGEKGDTGAAGANATINGVNVLTITAGSGISVSQSGSTLTISSSGGATAMTVAQIQAICT